MPMLFYIDSDLGAATRVRKTVSCCFAALRQLRHLREVSIVESRVDE